MECTQGDIPEFFFLYLGKENIYIFKTCCTISVLFPMKCLLFNSFIFFSSKTINIFYKACSKI